MENTVMMSDLARDFAGLGISIEKFKALPNADQQNIVKAYQMCFGKDVEDQTKKSVELLKRYRKAKHDMFKRKMQASVYWDRIRYTDKDVFVINDNPAPVESTSIRSDHLSQAEIIAMLYT